MNRLSLLALLLATACDTGTDSQPPQPYQSPFGSFPVAGPDASVEKVMQPTPQTTPPGFFGGPGGVAPTMRIVPTDDRAVVHGARRALPISGGTLLVTSDGAWAVAADPERDRVSIVDLRNKSLAANLDMRGGDEPGRIAEDDLHRVHVALRRGGAVVTIDPSTQTLLARRAVCAAPRGIAFDPATRALQVACASGELVTLPADGGEVASKVTLGADLRDVIVTPSGTLVSRFKRAELAHLDANGTLGPAQRGVELTDTFPEATGATVVDHLQPDMAWRTRLAPDGSIYMLHEGAREGEIDIDHSMAQVTPSPDFSPYGGSNQVDQRCAGVVQTELSVFDATGQYVTTGRFNSALAVDVAVSGDFVAVAEAGTRDPAQPQVTSFGPTPPAGGGIASPAGIMSTPIQGRVLVFSAAAVQSQKTPPENIGCVQRQTELPIAGQPVALAISEDRLVVQSREPATLTILPADPVKAAVAADDAGVDTSFGEVALGGDSVYDTGHELFHRAPGAQLACASCHGEGAEDGHVWVFSGQGKRRSQALHVGLAGTEPLHWDGELADVSALMEEVMVSRMGGVHESADRSAALRDFLYSLQAPAPLRSPDDPAAQRGKQVFEGPGGCTQCHSGVKLTNSQTVDVGTGKAFQVPSLVGVSQRGPWLHDGCAATLRQRFDPLCGGANHGQVAQLAPEQIDDLVAFLESL